MGNCLATEETAAELAARMHVSRAGKEEDFTEQDAQLAFGLFDQDGDGAISAAELGHVRVC